MFDQMCASNTNEISLKAINSLNFLDMCIKECLRLYPVLPLFGRELESPLKLEDHHYLPPRTHVITSPWFIHHNPKMYPEPEKFDPERFLPEKIRDRGICDYIPFSVGPRNCIGENLFYNLFISNIAHLVAFQVNLVFYQCVFY